MDSLLPDGDMGWAVDDFSVEELLDFGGLNEPELGGFGVEEEDSTKANTSSSSATATAATLSDELTPPADIGFPVIPFQDDDDAAELEWVSQFVDDSFSEFPPCSGGGVSPSIPENRWAESSTEVPTSPETPAPVKARRSKRSRSAGRAWSAGTRLPFTESSSSSTTTTSASCFDTNHLIEGNPPPPPPPKKQKKRGRTPDWGLIVECCCGHCGTQKTPQWREGPMGPKTLCNACGVRFKSGRLLPEYRPAGSPTFVPLVHSNNHRKVLELHRENLQAELSPPPPPPPGVAQGSSIQPSR